MARSFWISGKHAVLGAIKNKKRKVKQVLCTEKFDITLFPSETNYKLVNKKDLKKKLYSLNLVDQNICAEIVEFENPDITNIINRECIIILDKITDTRNLGSIFRTAAAFNVKDIIVHDRSFNDTSQAMYKTASGAIELINIYKVKNIVNTIKFLKKSNFWFYGLDVKTNTTVNKFTLFDKKTAFVLGSEDKGITNIVKKNCDELIKINIINEVESLNVSNSLAAILMSYSILKL